MKTLSVPAGPCLQNFDLICRETTPGQEDGVTNLTAFIV